MSDNRQFSTGAVRGKDDGRGKPSLLPYRALVPVLDMLDRIPMRAIIELSKVYEMGATKYSPRNWEKGIPLSSFLDSAMRHFERFSEGNTDEPHLGQYCFNVLGLLHTLGEVEGKRLPDDLFDLPINWTATTRQVRRMTLNLEFRPRADSAALSLDCLMRFAANRGPEFLYAAAAHGLLAYEDWVQ